MRSSFERASETSSLDPRVPNCLRVSNILFRIIRGRKAHVAHGRTWRTYGHCTLRTVENVRHKTTALKACAKLKWTLHDPTFHCPRLAGRSGARSRRVRPVPPRRGPCGPRRSEEHTSELQSP